jgi:hypothetical protein
MHKSKRKWSGPFMANWSWIWTNQIRTGSQSLWYPCQQLEIGSKYACLNDFWVLHSRSNVQVCLPPWLCLQWDSCLKADAGFALAKVAYIPNCKLPTHTQCHSVTLPNHNR